MSTAAAGWYADPLGDTTKIRYWDGTQWTDQYQAAADPNADAAPAQPGALSTTPVPTAYGSTGAQTAATTAAPAALYPMTESDRTMRLIAFILNLLTCIGLGVLIIPLAWMVPMTVHSWGIYKGTKPNTTAFGVCTLLFLNLISGILLLVTEKQDATPVQAQ